MDYNGTHSMDDLLQKAINTVPTGHWAVGVSGGADSVALLTLLRERADLTLHVVHLDHQTRGEASTGDALFVIQLAQRLGIDVTTKTLADVRPAIERPPTNRSALFRQARLTLFRQVVCEHRLDGVILAHHRLDQAETILIRLIRGSGPLGLSGIAPRVDMPGLTVLHPLLNVWPHLLRDELHHRGQTWRDDASNLLPAYRRNRVRARLSNEPDLVEALVELADAIRTLSVWFERVSPPLDSRFIQSALDGLPPFVREFAVRRWLARVGVPVDKVNQQVTARLLTMIDDAAVGNRADFPGGVHVVRRRGVIFAKTTVPSLPRTPPIQSRHHE